ncbi:MAG: NAD(P)-dependent oxidoreductase [Pseudomonadota bacterium]
MDSFPVFFRMDDAAVAVFGGGEAARRKVRLLAKTPAQIHVFAAQIAPDFVAEFEGRVAWHAPTNCAPILETCRFAIIAEPAPAAAQVAFAAVRAARLPVNRVDEKAWCDFTIPSILDRGRVVAAVASGGAAPVLARDLRGELERIIPPETAALADLAAGLRAAVKIAFSEEKDRRRFWEHFFHGPVARHILAGAPERPMDAIRAAFDAAAHPEGPADPVEAPPLVTLFIPPETHVDDMTLRAFRALQRAEWVALPPGTPPALLEKVRRDADRTAFSGDRTALVAAARLGLRCIVFTADEDAPTLAAALTAEGIATRTLR